MSVDNSAHIKTATNLKGLALKDFFKGAYGLSASACCICSKRLRDAESIEVGIGPDCRKNHGYTNEPASNVDLAKALNLMAQARIEMDVFQYILANKDSVRMMNNILIAYCTYLMGQRRGAEIIKVTPIIRAFGYTLLADKLEVDRTKHKFLPLGNGHTFFRTESKIIVRWMMDYLRMSPVAVSGYSGKGFILDTQEKIDVAEWLCAKHEPKDLVFTSGGAAMFDINSMTEPAVIANYLAQLRKNTYAFAIEFDPNLGAHTFRYPYPCPKVYHGLANLGITKETVAGYSHPQTVLRTPDQVALAIWLVAGEIGGSGSLYLNGADVPLAVQSTLPVPNLIANPAKKTTGQINFKVWYSSAQSINVATPVPWEHPWVTPLQGVLKGLGAKFDSATKSWRLPKSQEAQLWGAIEGNSPYTRGEFPPVTA